MEVWRSGDPLSGPLEGSSVTVEGIGTFDTVTINGRMAFPYLDINLSWSESQQLTFSVHRKPGKLVKYLNCDSVIIIGNIRRLYFLGWNCVSHFSPLVHR
jgi:hypothetical protein